MRPVQPKIKSLTKSFSKINETTLKKKSNCYVFGKPGHFANKCRYRKGDHNPLKANLVDGEEIIAAVVVSRVNMVAPEGKKEWVIDSGATKHICSDVNSFFEYVQQFK